MELFHSTRINPYGSLKISQPLPTHVDGLEKIPWILCVRFRRSPKPHSQARASNSQVISPHPRSREAAFVSTQSLQAQLSRERSSFSVVQGTSFDVFNRISMIGGNAS